MTTSGLAYHLEALRRTRIIDRKRAAIERLNALKVRKNYVKWYLKI